MDDKTILVGAQFGGTSSIPSDAPPPYSVATAGDQVGQPVLVNVAMVTADQRTVHCQVCQRVINLKGNEIRVKCQGCGEITPIRPAPTGKKYARCPCNCLLICTTGAVRVICPRTTCKKVLTLPISVALGQSNASTPTSDGGGSVRAHCACCGSPFNVTYKGWTTGISARCPHCHSLSSVGPRFARTLWITFGVLGFISLALGLGMTFGTYELASRNGGIYVVWIGAFIMAIGFFLRSLLYCCMPVSRVEFPTGPA